MPSPLEVELIPILSDNYVFLIKNKLSQTACLVDPGESEICLEYLKRNNLNLLSILITHHHYDHIDGIAGLRAFFSGVQVYAPYKNQGQILGVDHWVQEGDMVSVPHFADFQVIELPGHTLGHIGYFQSQKAWLFLGDVLFGLGCGRLFEGSPKVAFHSLQKIKKFPPETQIFCAHEYTDMNLKFTESLVKSRKIPSGFEASSFSGFKTSFFQKKVAAIPSVPLVLADEMRWNAFLLCENVEEFTHLRELRNHFSG